MKEAWECMVYKNSEDNQFVLYEIIYTVDEKTIAQFNFGADEFEMPRVDGAELAIFNKAITYEAVFRKASQTKGLYDEDKKIIKLIKNNMVKRMESKAAGLATYKYIINAQIEDDFDLMEEVQKSEIQERIDLQLDRFKEVIAQKDFMRANDIMEFGEGVEYLPINKVF